MSAFIFNFDSLGSADGLGSLSSIAGSVSSFEAGLLSSTPDDKLTYSGTDPIVWDRTNNERLRRGLSPLSNPRPVDDGKTYNTRGGGVGAGAANKSAKTFEINGPPGMTREEAFKIFQEQAKAGGLTGFKPGDTLSAATQAAQGLPGAQASLAQALSGISPELSSFTAGLSIPSNLSATVQNPIGRGVVSMVEKNIQSSENIAAAINSTPVGDVITVNEYATQNPALTSIANLNPAQVTATLAAAQKLSGQTATQATDTGGIGKYGFSCDQLERAGYVKPGTAAKYLNQDSNTLTSVLQSYSSWTGQDGTATLDQFLSNDAKQDQAQQQLMSQGLQLTKQLGVSTENLSTQQTGALAMNSAVDVNQAVAWVKKQPLASSAIQSFNSRARDGAYAVDLTKEKLNDSLLREEPEAPEVNTTNRLTLNAATLRIVGNDKIPSAIPEATGAASLLLFGIKKLVDSYQTELRSIQSKLVAAETSGAITNQQYDLLRNQYQNAVLTFNNRYPSLVNIGKNIVAADSNAAEQGKFSSEIAATDATVAALETLKNDILNLLARVGAKVVATLF